MQNYTKRLMQLATCHRPKAGSKITLRVLGLALVSVSFRRANFRQNAKLFPPKSQKVTFKPDYYNMYIEHMICYISECFR
jgi:hypothetical protein